MPGLGADLRAASVPMLRQRGDLWRRPAMRNLPRVPFNLREAIVPMLRQRRNLRGRACLQSDSAGGSGLRAALALDAGALDDPPGTATCATAVEQSDAAWPRRPGPVPVAVGSTRRLLHDGLGSQSSLPRLHSRHGLQLRVRKFLRQLHQRPDHHRVAARLQRAAGDHSLHVGSAALSETEAAGPCPAANALPAWQRQTGRRLRACEALDPAELPQSGAAYL
jgi:hypothetical protein